MEADKQQEEPACLCCRCSGEMYKGDFGWDFGSEGIWCDDCVNDMDALQHKWIFDNADRYERILIGGGDG